MTFVDQVKELGLPLDQVVVIGSGLLDQLGLRESHDIDLVVSPDIFDGLRTDPSYVIGEKNGDRFCTRGKFDIWSGWEDVSYDELHRTAQKIDGVWFVSTDILIQKKRKRGLAKDLHDIALLEEYDVRK